MRLGGKDACVGQAHAGHAGGLVVVFALLAFAALVAALCLAPRAEALIYWTSAEGQTTLGRANLNGKAPDEQFITGAASPAGLDITDSHIYWLNIQTHAIGRAKLNGRMVNQAFIETDPLDRVWGLGIGGRQIYWAALTSRTIGRANLGGGGLTPGLIDTDNAAIDVAARGNKLYWINYGNSIGRANRNGTAVEQNFIPGLSNPAGLAVDRRFVYWTDNSGGSIGRARIDGSSAANPNFITGLPDPAGITVTDSHIYWTNYYGQSIGRAKLNGTQVKQTLVSLNTRAYGVAVDWALNPGSRFRIGRAKLNRSNGTAKLAVKVPGPGKLTLRGAGLKRTSNATKRRNVRLAVRPGSALAQALARSGSARVTAKVTFKPKLGPGKRTKSKRLTLANG